MCTLSPDTYLPSVYSHFIISPDLFERLTFEHSTTHVTYDHRLHHLHQLQQNGYVVASYDVGDGQQSLVESRKRFHDGQYHYVTFVRNGGNATLRVDEFPAMMINTRGTNYKRSLTCL